MDSSPTLLTRPPLPSPTPGQSWIADSSPFLSILTLLALLGTVILIYALFFSIKCPPNSFHRLHRRSGGFTRRRTNTINLDQLVSNITYQKEENGRDSGGGGGECPVCLTAFVDGEVIRQVNACKHLFHGACIDMWLDSHSSCPVCRAFITTKLPKPLVVDGENDLRRGLPDSASLV